MLICLLISLCLCFASLLVFVLFCFSLFAFAYFTNRFFAVFLFVFGHIFHGPRLNANFSNKPSARNKCVYTSYLTTSPSSTFKLGMSLYWFSISITIQNISVEGVEGVEGAVNGVSMCQYACICLYGLENYYRVVSTVTSAIEFQLEIFNFNALTTTQSKKLHHHWSCERNNCKKKNKKIIILILF